MDSLDIAIAQASGSTRLNTARVGNFTSSEIGALMTSGKVEGALSVPALTYVEEVNLERKSGRALSEEVDARPLIWGRVCERYVSTLLDDVVICSNITLDHPTIPYWKGSPDTKGENLVGDIKCPKTLKSFLKMVEAFEGGLTESDQLARFRKAGKETNKYYWQLVSNAILTDSEFAELILFCPYKSELDNIRAVANMQSGLGDNTSWIVFARDEELPYLIDGGYYKNLYRFRFTVPIEDKEALTYTVKQAEKLLFKTI